jgi:hypothetical protein
MRLLPKTQERVPEHTADDVNRQIREQTADRLRYYAQHPGEIPARLKQLDHEWDIERTLEANAAGFGLGGLALGAFVWRRFYLFPAMILGFLMQHALQGWCPPVPIFRRRGFRTVNEINAEKDALRRLQQSGARRRHGKPTRAELRKALRQVA